MSDDLGHSDNMTLKEFFMKNKKFRHDVLKGIAAAIAVPALLIGVPTYIKWKGITEPEAARADVLDRGYSSLEYIGQAPVTACSTETIAYARDAFRAVAPNGRAVHVARCRNMWTPSAEVRTYRP